MRTSLAQKILIFLWRQYLEIEFNGSGLTIQNNFAHTTNQNISNCHIN
jgi:hypothetical protein